MSPNDIVPCLLVNIGLFIVNARIQLLETHSKLLYNLIKHYFRHSGVNYLSRSNCMRSLVSKNSRSGGWSTFCLPEQKGSRGLLGVKVRVMFAKGPWSSSANKSLRSNIKSWCEGWVGDSQQREKKPSTVWHHICSLNISRLDKIPGASLWIWIEDFLITPQLTSSRLSPTQSHAGLFPNHNPPGQVTRGQLCKPKSLSGMRVWEGWWWAPSKLHIVRMLKKKKLSAQVGQ